MYGHYHSPLIFNLHILDSVLSTLKLVRYPNGQNVQAEKSERRGRKNPFILIQKENRDQQNLQIVVREQAEVVILLTLWK